MTETLTRRYGRLLFVGKGPAISAQLQAMARREGFHIEDQRITESTAALAALETSKGEPHEAQVASPFLTKGLCRPSTRHRPPPSIADILEGLRTAPLGRVPSDEPTFMPADKLVWRNSMSGRLG